MTFSLTPPNLDYLALPNLMETELKLPRGTFYLNEEVEHIHLSHISKWRGCQACPLSQDRKKIVHYRGQIPCDILFLGEAPGESEDALGQPFVGEAGHKFDELLLRAYEQAGIYTEDTFIEDQIIHLKPSWGVTNICCCIPREKCETGTGKLRPPTRQEAQACSPRLADQIEICRPKIIICLGQIPYRFLKMATKQLSHTRPPFSTHANLSSPLFKEFQFLHPSAINREDRPFHKSLLEKRWVVQLSTILKGLANADY